MNLREAAQQATPREQLLKELMDSRVPKTEREHAAAREIERLSAALAEATIKDNLTVEPVAWLQIGVGPLHEGTVIARTAKPKTWNPEWWRFEPLYPAPPQRKPLTDEQIQECVGKVDDARLSGSITEFARAVERAHGIGGEE